MNKHLLFTLVMTVLIVAMMVYSVVLMERSGMPEIAACRRAAEAAQVNWMWGSAEGCVYEQPDGTWSPLSIAP